MGFYEPGSEIFSEVKSGLRLLPPEDHSWHVSDSDSYLEGSHVTVPQLEEAHFSLIQVDEIVDPFLCLLLHPVCVGFKVVFLLKFETKKQV